MKKPLLVGSPIILGLLVTAVGLGGCASPEPEQNGQIAVVGPKRVGKVRPRGWSTNPVTGAPCWIPEPYVPPEGGSGTDGSSGGDYGGYGDDGEGEGGYDPGASGGSWDTYSQEIVGSGIYDVEPPPLCPPLVDDPTDNGTSSGGPYV